MIYGDIGEYVYEIMIGIGIISSLVSVLIISVSFQVFQGIYAFIFGISYLDCLLSLSLIYTGFYGLFLTTYGSGSNSSLPEECLYTAFFLLIWIIYDVGTFLIIFVQSLDRFIHSITSLWHEKYQNYIMTICSFFFCLLLSILSVVPLIQYSIEISANDSIAISSGCYEKDVFGNRYYLILAQFRFYSPMFNLLIILFVIIIHIIRRNIGILNFANTAFDKDTNWITIIITLRSLFEILICGSFTLIISSSTTNDYLFRCTQSFVFVIFQLFVNYCWLENYKIAFNKTFQRYMKNNTKNWQSADDPPVNFLNRSRNSITSMFGSWYSVGGNIMGEAGIPRVDDFHRNMSISFYCEDNVVVFEDNNPTAMERF